jgi:hypothetical protein
MLYSCLIKLAGTNPAFAVRMLPLEYEACWISFFPDCCTRSFAAKQNWGAGRFAGAIAKWQHRCAQGCTGFPLLDQVTAQSPSAGIF